MPGADATPAPPAGHQTLDLLVLPGTLAVCRMPAGSSWPDWLEAPGFVSVTRTDEETSIVCASSCVPQGVRAESGWRAIRIDGTLDFALTGILLSLLQPLAAACVPVFTLSTFDTDYVLVQEATLARAIDALVAAGHRVGVVGSEGGRGC
jgi:uncharacterized protein